MSYKVEIMDEYSFGQWFSDSLRFATEAEAIQHFQSFHGGWSGILDLRVVPSDDDVSACWSDEGITNKTGKPLYNPPPPPSREKILEQAKNLGAAWDAIVNRIGSSPSRRRSERFPK